MLTTRSLMMPRKFYADLDYAKHMPKAYVDRMKGHVPKKIYDNRFGAPPVIRWTIPPDDYKSTTRTADDGTELTLAKRPWENDIVENTMQRKHEYMNALLANKFFRKSHRIKPIPAESWTIFPGDLVMVMIGKDKGRQGLVTHVIRDQNAVFVEGLHTKLFESISKQMAKSHGINKQSYAWLEQPLFVHLGQVMLVDPNDKDWCHAKWILNHNKTEYIRVSTRTGYEIPLPNAAYQTYEYNEPSNYIEVQNKDTSPDTVLKCTYIPKLCTFEQEIEDEMGLGRRQEKKPQTYWY